MTQQTLSDNNDDPLSAVTHCPIDQAVNKQGTNQVTKMSGKDVKR
jgi:hypothetical protein